MLDLVRHILEIGMLKISTLEIGILKIDILAMLR